MYFAIFVTSVWLLFVCARPAFAYIDPGSGGMLIQLLLGGVAGAVVLVRLYWQRLLAMFGMRKRDADHSQ